MRDRSPLPAPGHWPVYDHKKGCTCGHQRQQWISEFDDWAVAVMPSDSGFWRWEVHQDMPGWHARASGESPSKDQAKLDGEAAAHRAWGIRHPNLYSYAPAQDRKGQPLVPGDRVRIKMHPRGTTEGRVIISPRQLVVLSDGSTLPALTVMDDDGTSYALHEKGTLKL